jgi:hypothetical protein
MNGRRPDGTPRNWNATAIGGAMGAQFKWLAGIAASIIAGVAIWQLMRQPPAPPPPAPNLPAPTADGPSPVVCHASGAVYDRDDSRPLGGIEVHYSRRTQDSSPSLDGARSRLATTGPDGRFSADCSSVEAENFPLRLELVASSWRGRFQTDEYIPRGERRTGINIYVAERLLRKR